MKLTPEAIKALANLAYYALPNLYKYLSRLGISEISEELAKSIRSLGPKDHRKADIFLADHIQMRGQTSHIKGHESIISNVRQIIQKPRIPGSSSNESSALTDIYLAELAIIAQERDGNSDGIIAIVKDAIDYARRFHSNEPAHAITIENTLNYLLENGKSN